MAPKPCTVLSTTREGKLVDRSCSNNEDEYNSEMAVTESLGYRILSTCPCRGPETPNMCSTCQPTTRKRRKTNLKQEPPRCKLEVSASPSGILRQTLCVDATSPSQTDQRCHHPTSARKRSASPEKGCTKKRAKKHNQHSSCNWKATHSAEIGRTIDHNHVRLKSTRVPLATRLSRPIAVVTWISQPECCDISTLSNLARQAIRFSEPLAHSCINCKRYAQEPPRNIRANAETTLTQSARREQHITCVTIILREHT